MMAGNAGSMKPKPVSSPYLYGSQKGVILICYGSRISEREMMAGNAGSMKPKPVSSPYLYGSQ